MQSLKITGILQLSLASETIDIIKSLQKELPKIATPISDKDLHITLLKLSKDDRTKVNSIPKEVWNSLVVDRLVRPLSGILTIERPELTINEKIIKAKKSWIVATAEQAWLRSVVDNIAELAHISLSEYETSRPFHISIANLTGSPFDSVGDVTWDDFRNS